jgi:ribosomal protein S18 acetylase RimI-like enzyme
MEFTMTITARHYRDHNDFEQMQALLVTGRQSDNRAYYVHPGDLGRWLFHSNENAADSICLWEWNSHLAGFSLLSTTNQSFDVFVLPEFHGRPFEAKILLWAEISQAQKLRNMHNNQIHTMWVAETDLPRINWLKIRGFHPNTKGLFLMQRSLLGPIQPADLPSGYTIRHSYGSQDAHERALAAHTAFESEKSLEDCRAQMIRIMGSQIYDPQNDILVCSPSGEIVSFCQLWPDRTTRVGMFEQVGTHPFHRRLGLAKAVMTAGMQRLKDLGMTHASICVETDNLPAIRLLERMGFAKMNRLLTFEKSLN